jgi:hypothetical protein
MEELDANFSSVGDGTIINCIFSLRLFMLIIWFAIFKFNCIILSLKFFRSLVLQNLHLCVSIRDELQALQALSSLIYYTLLI